MLSKSNIINTYKICTFYITIRDYFFFFRLGIIGMFFSNEHLARSILHSQQVAKSIIDDTNTFVRNSHLQIRFVATTTMDQAIDATIADIEGNGFFYIRFLFTS